MKNIHTIRRLRLARGVSIVTAIFLLVVLSGLGVAIVTVSTSAQRSSVQDLLGSRAYEAARSGVEYGMYQLTQASQCTGTTFVPGGSLSAFTVTVQCTTTSTAMKDGSALTQSMIRATACNQPANGACPNAAPSSADYVQRVVEVRFGG